MKLKLSLILLFLSSTHLFSAEKDLDVDVVTSKKNLNLLESMLKESSETPQKEKSDSLKNPGFTMPAPQARFIGTSLVLQAAAGASSATDTELTELQTGFHDPRRRGFTFQAGEFSLSGAVDPYFKAEMHANFSESAVELEEAFMTTTNLPASLELEIGYFLTEFGRNNPRHGHDKAFIDQSLTVGRFFGGEGQRGSGFRLSGLIPASWLSEWHIGLQNTNGGLTPSFESTGTTTVGGRPVVAGETRSFADMIALVRLVNGFTVSRHWETQFGLSALLGPNSTGAEGETQILGADLVLNWTSPKQYKGAPYFKLELEATQRNFEAAAGTSNGQVYESEDLKDWAYLVEAIYGFTPSWSTGLRYEQAGGKGASFSQLRSADPDRSDRTRISPIVTYKPSEFSRVSLQYNYDKVDHLTDKTHNSVWLSFQVLIGTHPAHQF